MVAEVKSFDLVDDDDEYGEDKPFKVRYQRREYVVDPKTQERKPTGKWEPMEETFTARAEVPAGVTVSLLAAFSMSNGMAARAITDFIRTALIEADEVRFMTLIHDPDNRVKLKNLAKITDWLVEEYGERPTVGV